MKTADFLIGSTSVLVLFASSCGGVEEENEAGDPACVGAPSKSECDNFDRCTWAGTRELTVDEEGCHREIKPVCVHAVGGTAGEGITGWRTLANGEVQVIQFGDGWFFEDDTWTDCAESDADPPAACACEDPDF